MTKDGSTPCDGLSAADFRISEDGQAAGGRVLRARGGPGHVHAARRHLRLHARRARLVFEALETFIATMRPGDRASIVLLATTAKVVQEETADRQALLAATDRIPEDFNDGTALYEVLYGQFREVEAQGCSADAGPRRSCSSSSPTARTRRRAARSREEVLDAVRHTDLAVYPVAMTWHNAFLERLARETGGRVSYVSHGGELADAYRAISAEVSSQYTIGYAPRALPPPGAWHPVRVTVAKKGITVRHRAGYFTPARPARVVSAIAPEPAE